jgi:predicted nuclease of predicted toxin-antitoxin system
LRFLADESCDFGIVTALRAAGHDVSAVVDRNPGAEDEVILTLARSESRVLLTEDKDFGLLAYAGGQENAGVILIRFPGNARARSVKPSPASSPNSAIGCRAGLSSSNQGGHAFRVELSNSDNVRPALGMH